MLQVHDSLQEQRSALDYSAQLSDINAAISTLQKQGGAILEEARSRRSSPRVLCHIGIQSTPPQRLICDLQPTPAPAPPARKSAAVQVTPPAEPITEQPRKPHSPGLQLTCSVPVLRISGHATNGLPRRSPAHSDKPRQRHGHDRGHYHNGSAHTSRRFQPRDARRARLPEPHARPEPMLPAHPSVPQSPVVHAGRPSNPPRPGSRSASPCGSTQQSLSRRDPGPSDAGDHRRACHRSTRAQEAVRVLRSEGRVVVPDGRGGVPLSSCAHSAGRRATARSRAALLSVAQDAAAATACARPPSRRTQPVPSGRSGTPAHGGRANGPGAALHPRLRASSGARTAQQCRSQRAVAEATRASRRLRERLSGGRQAQLGPPSRPVDGRSMHAAPPRKQPRPAAPGPERKAAPGQEVLAAQHGSGCPGTAQCMDTEVKSISPLSLVVPRQKRGRHVGSMGTDRVCNLHALPQAACSCNIHRAATRVRPPGYCRVRTRAHPLPHHSVNLLGFSLVSHGSAWQDCLRRVGPSRHTWRTCVRASGNRFRLLHVVLPRVCAV